MTYRVSMNGLEICCDTPADVRALVEAFGAPVTSTPRRSSPPVANPFVSAPAVGKGAGVVEGAPADTILAHLSHRGPASKAALASALKLDGGRVTRALQALAAAGRVTCVGRSRAATWQVKGGVGRPGPKESP